MQTIAATYDPADDTLRLYPASRLDAETYARVKAAGYHWAPKQGCFYATWTPSRADLVVELAGKIDDEDTTLTDRADDRATRFAEYSDKRATEAQSAHAVAEHIMDGIPLGQPILIGHHSERHARKDAERIENSLRKAVSLWDTAQYWQERAKGAIRHAKYKQRPDVRARRIKGLEADLRKEEKTKARAQKFSDAWASHGHSAKNAMALANYDHISKKFPWPSTRARLPHPSMKETWGCGRH